MKELRQTCIILFLSIGLTTTLKLTILHTNDVHSRIEQMNKHGSQCSAKDAAANKCFGGVARRYTVITDIRKKTKNVLLLDGGDQFQGTLWFTTYKGQAAARFMNLMKYDAMAIGNHEFDNGVRTLVSFLKATNFSKVSANIDGSKEPLWPKIPPLVKKSIIQTKEGQQIGIIGYTIKETIWLSSPGPNLKFSSEVEAVRAEAAKLKAAGVKIIIALGHAGIKMDRVIAREVADVDIVVGGHTDTFLYTGTPPSNEVPIGTYPLVINPKSKPSHKTLIVQDYTFGKYLGKLDVTFDSEGEITSYGGNPILLNGSFAEDPGVLRIVNNMSVALRNFSRISVGTSHVLLDGKRSHCRLVECNMGNMIADAMVEMNQRSPDESKWAEVSIAILNGGNIRATIDKKPSEFITYGDVLTVLPFGNTADVVTMKGVYLKQALEHSVAGYDVEEQFGGFLQVSGLRVTYDLRKPPGSRVKTVWVMCGECRVPEFKPLNQSEVYKVLVPSFIARGGDGYTVLSKNAISRHPGSTIESVVAEYIKIRSPVIPKLDRRITFFTGKECKTSSSSMIQGYEMHMLMSLIVLIFAGGFP